MRNLPEFGEVPGVAFARQSDINFIFRQDQEISWMDSIQAKVAVSLILLVFLAIPGFFLMLQNASLILYYLVYPAMSALGLYLIYRGKKQWGSAVVTLSVYGVVAWMASLVGIATISKLNWWIISLLPWVMFEKHQRMGLITVSLIPIIFSFYAPYIPETASSLLPAEREFLRQILRISVALGAFSCLFFLRQAYYELKDRRRLENEFFSNTLNSIPLPIIIKDGITLDFLFFNTAAQLTYDLNPVAQNSNRSIFSESSAASISRLDQEVLRSITYHIEPDENLVHQSGLHWHFRTYRIPFQLHSNGRRLLISISEDLRALKLMTRRAEERNEILGLIFRLSSPLIVRFDRKTKTISVVNPSETMESWQAIKEGVTEYLERYLLQKGESLTRSTDIHRFTLQNRRFDFYHALDENGAIIQGMVMEFP
jgi:hypothetical protein